MPQLITSSGQRSEIPGPADLACFGEGDSLRLSGDLDPGRWAVAIGLFALRGGTVLAR